MKNSSHIIKHGIAKTRYIRISHNWWVCTLHVSCPMGMPSYCPFDITIESNIYEQRNTLYSYKEKLHAQSMTHVYAQI